jgi:hypothetical protein
VSDASAVRARDDSAEGDEEQPTTWHDLVVPSLRWVEGQIRRVEGFDVAFRHPDGRDVRGDMQDVASYPFVKRLGSDRTVAEWKRLRFHQRYRGFEIEVHDVDGSSVHGGTLLGSLRARYGT